jgi:D-alanyl-D-alanine carboxypeptidase (penicillin-binding protein 5/6)
MLLLRLLTVFALISSTASAQTIATTARNAFLVDMSTNTVLLDEKGEEKMPTSSMSKMMTMYVVFQALKDKKISLEDEFAVSERAWRMEGSRSFANLGAKVKVEDLIRGVIIQSGNDASVVVAEGVAGSEGAFVTMMNQQALALGMKNSHFANVAGLPEPEHYSTAQDLAILAQRIITDFPEYYHYFGEKEFVMNNIKQGNRNPLLYRNMGVDGLKTGHAEEAGYGITASARRGDRRLVLVVNGLKNMQERADEAARLLEFGYGEFDLVQPHKAGEAVGESAIVLGTAKAIPAVLTQDAKLTIHKTQEKNLKWVPEIKGPLEAPVAKGAEIGILQAKLGDQTLASFPLVAAADVPRLGFFPLMWAKIKFMVTGKYD